MGDTWGFPKDGAVLVYVPAGEFQMGSIEGSDDEDPVHTVALDAFWLDQHEVSVAQFQAFAVATGYETEAEQEGWGWVWRGEGWEKVDGADWQHPYGPDSRAEDEHPVVQVSWNDAVAYCTWAGRRLPTEAEWAYAARGPEAQIYPWGDEFDGTLCNFCDVNCEPSWADQAVDDGYAMTAPVGSFPDGASWAGALDMAGNVWEWVADWYQADYYDDAPRENPKGPETGEYRGLRGGSWGSSARIVRSATRHRNTPTTWFASVGFRCAIAARRGP
jgi:formylglycine-generating enzyme required for sulfatase activity